MPTSSNELSETAKKLQPNKRQHRPIRKHHRLKLAFFIFCIIFVSASGIFFYRFTKLYQQAHQTATKVYSSAHISKARDTQQLLQQGKPISILLMGTDTGALGRNFKGRTDTLIVLVLNPQKQKMTLVSLPRDALVAIYGFENSYPSKLNSAYDYGGSGTAVKTVQKYLNIPIDFYATINMGGLENLVNAVNGVTITPTLTFSYGGYSFKKNIKQDLNGKQALAYVRMRHSDPLGDYGRQLRQRQVLTAISHKGSNLKSLMSSTFFNEIGNELRTDLTFKDLELLAFKYRHTSRNLVSDHAQGTQDVIDGVSFEAVSENEKQRVTNELRKALQLESATTGNTLSSSNQININSINDQ